MRGAKTRKKRRSLISPAGFKGTMFAVYGSEIKCALANAAERSRLNKSLKRFACIATDDRP